MTDLSPTVDQPADPTFYLVEEDDHHAPTGGGTLIGFWIYLMSDALIFATLFATYGVVAMNYAGGPGPEQVFQLPLVALNTALLLFSSITYGMATIDMQAGRLRATQAWLAITALFGMAFVGIELYEFGHLIHEGATPQRSAFLSGFFTLVGTHGLHVTFGLIWIFVMIAQLRQRGLSLENQRRVVCLGMFWHLLDVVWIGVFTFVYLLGAIR